MGKHLLLVVSCMIVSLEGFSGGIRGKISSAEGALEFASIYVKGIRSAISANGQGFYEIALPPGTYEVAYQYIGYETETRVVEVTQDFVEVNVTLRQQVMELSGVIIRAQKEDPAYTIMRKAIAKAPFHANQLNQYRVMTYLKGRIKLKDIPWWLSQKKLEKEAGIKLNQLYIAESVVELTYKRPNQYNERTVAIYAENKEQKKVSENAMLIVKNSFYNPTTGTKVSPLSPRAFLHYRFEYKGSYKEGERTISKIQVIPRSQDEALFSGTLYLTDEDWSIHSLDFLGSSRGVAFRVKQIFNPVQKNVWLPVSQYYATDGKLLGFAFEATYLISFKNYNITLNPDLNLAVTVIDEKIDKDAARKVEAENKKKKNTEASTQMTRKELNKTIKNYVKSDDKKNRKDKITPAVAYTIKQTVDSSAYQKDSLFWKEFRDVRLDQEELASYHVIDSMKTTFSRNIFTQQAVSQKFQFYHPIIGNTYQWKNNHSLRLLPSLNYNTVEGFVINYIADYKKEFLPKDTLEYDSNLQKRALTVTPTLRYAFSRKVFSGALQLKYQLKTWQFRTAGGRLIRQFNANNPIRPFINTVTTLLFEDNWIKLYEHYFAELEISKRLWHKWHVSLSAYWAERHALENSSNVKIFNWPNKDFTTNGPDSHEMKDASFTKHNALILSATVAVYPLQKIIIRNGKTEYINRDLMLSVLYRKGTPTLFNSAVNFDQIEIEANHVFSIKGRPRLLVQASAGAFLRSPGQFINYKHFDGNETPFVLPEQFNNFKLLPYYKYSTSKQQYLFVHTTYAPYRLLLTYMSFARRHNLREEIMVSHLSTASGHYTEGGYALQNIFGFLRTEFVMSFQKGRTYGFRIGFSKDISRFVRR